MKNGNTNELLQIINLLISKSETLLIWLDADLKIKFISQTAKNLYGWEDKEVIGNSYPEECKASSIQCIDLSLLVRALKGESFLRYTNKIKNAKYKSTVQWDISPIHDKNKVTNLVMIGFDLVRDIKKGSYLYNIINNIPQYIFWKDRDSMFLGCNQVFAQSAGLASPEEIVGKTDYDLPWKKSDSDAYRSDDQEVMQNNRPKLNIEEPQTFPNGEIIILLTNKVPLHDENGGVVGVLGVYSDITELKKSQAALEKAKGQIDGMALLSASIAHELRTPLAAIKSITYGIEAYLPNLVDSHVLAKNHQLPVSNINEENLEKFNEAISNINKKVNHSNMVIDMLLTNLAYNQINSSNFTQCSIKECVQQAVEKYVFTEGQVELVHVDIQKDFSFVGKSILIVHILFNLFKNALYFIQKSGKGEIYIWCDINNGINRLHFKDTGQGISENELPYIFDQFYSKGIHHGTGVGLAFSKMVMQAHQGDISCHSIYEEYSEFILTFPSKINFCGR